MLSSARSKAANASGGADSGAVEVSVAVAATEGAVEVTVAVAAAAGAVEVTVAVAAAAGAVVATAVAVATAVPLGTTVEVKAPAGAVPAGGVLVPLTWACDVCVPLATSNSNDNIRTVTTDTKNLLFMYPVSFRNKQGI